MDPKTYTDSALFLRATQDTLESDEAATGLMLGICGHLARHPARFRAAPCLKTVEDEAGLVLAAIMTPPQKLVVYAHQGDMDGGARALVESLAREGWHVPGVLGPSPAAARVAGAWSAFTGRETRLGRRQRVYELRQVLTPVPARGQLRPATAADLDLAARWWYEFHVDIFGKANREETAQSARFRIEQGDLYLWDDEGPVSLANKTRPTRRGISIGPVYTPPELRRRGYATACVGELARLLLASGREFCALFADLANPTSNHIYQEIGFRPVCDYDEYTFLERE
ncbi:MAG: hypothetical protein KKA73_28585 [Chloroflexi bacterium]|nr:hypothetical protein [Chloroflexota bacterium]MBU1751651.1 hypothetical protein [Chloroflexota bacterium]MBU1878485.1 hypothetical protein [Chloroflexota bacterium]